MRRAAVWAGFLAVAVVPAAPALAASGYATPTIRAWHQGDLCNKKAFELFPDYTKEHIAKRDAYVRKCLAEQNLPARENLAPK